MRNRYVLLLDLPLVVIAAFGAFALRFDWLFLNYRREFWAYVGAALIIKPIILHLFGMYRRYWRFATTNDLLAVTLATSTCSVGMAVFVAIGYYRFQAVGDFSRAVLMIDWLLTLVLVGGLRMSVRVMGEAQQRARKAAGRETGKRVLVVGAGEAGAMVVRELQRNPQLDMNPIGFLDDDPVKLGKRIYGVFVMGKLAALSSIVKLGRVEDVIVAMPTASGTSVRAVVEACQALGIRSRTIPGVYELLDGQVSVSRLRTVEITDLLRRDHLASPGADSASRYLQNATVLVTGAGGSIGQELCRQVAHARPLRLVLFGHGENSIFDVESMLRAQYPFLNIVSVIGDIRDERRVDSVFLQYRPDLVLHAAAHKHVPLMEENAVEAISNNVIGTHTVARAAIRHRAARFVLISTDKAVAPTSIMGASKRMAEMIVRQLSSEGATVFVVVRFGNVLGSRGSVVPIFKAQIERGGPITITHPDMKRFFMTIPEAVNLVLRAGGLGRGGELFVLNMGAPVKISDLAEDLIKLSGCSPADIPIVYTQLRAGEKLEESLWEDNAIVQETEERDILRVSEPVNELSIPIDVLLRQLQSAVFDGDRLAIEAALAQCIPTFVPGLPSASSFRPAAPRVS